MFVGVAAAQVVVVVSKNGSSELRSGVRVLRVECRLNEGSVLYLRVFVVFFRSCFSQGARRANEIRSSAGMTVSVPRRLAAVCDGWVQRFHARV